MKLRIYAGEDYTKWGFAWNHLIDPLIRWRQNPRTDIDTKWWHQLPTHTSLDRYRASAQELFELSSLADCDLAILPPDWNRVRGGAHWLARPDRKLVQHSLAFVDEVRESGKPLAVFFAGDRSHEPLPFKADLVFRNSLIGSHRMPGDFSFPGMVEDFHEQYLDGTPAIRRKGPAATVGFCGYARSKSPTTWVKAATYQTFMLTKYRQTDVSPFEGAHLRAKAIDTLERSRAVSANMLVYGRRVLFDNALTADQRRANRADYVRNMVESDYVLCTMGTANYSLRLFETLSCGRIPLFVDTDCVLPYDFCQDWRDYCVWVDWSDLPYIDERVADFHNDISPSDFQDRQVACREFWKNWLSAEGFFANLHRHMAPVSASELTEDLPDPLAAAG